MSLLDYMAAQTREYKQEAQQNEDRLAQAQAQRSAAIWAQQLAAQREGGEQQKRQAQAQAQAEAYSEAKLREQQGLGVAVSGDAYSDARLRDQLGLPPKDRVQKTPLANYLGAVDSPESYRSAMMQYIAGGGQKPRWYTGNYEMDKQNIDTAINATMTPKEQLIRQEAQDRIESTKVQREATQLYKEEQLRLREREMAAKREKVVPQKSVPTKDERNMALDATEEVLGADLFAKMPSEQQNGVAREVASRAKARIAQGEKAEYGDILNEELDKLIAEGKLKPGKEGSWFFGMGGEAPSFSSRGVVGVKPAAAVPPVPKSGEVVKGYQYLGGDPSNRASWKKVAQ